MERYDGKPFLRLLECYVLSAIGQLDERQHDALRLMEPKLHSVYGLGGTWQEVVRSQMGFPDSLPRKIYKIWEKNLATAHANRMTVDPNEFAITFVNQNFPNIVN